MPEPSKPQKSGSTINQADNLQFVLQTLRSVSPVELTLDQRLSLIVEKVRASLGASLVSLFTIDPASQQPMLRAFSSPETTKVLPDGFRADWPSRSSLLLCLNKNKAVLSGKVSFQAQDPRAALGQDSHDCAAFPISEEKNILAILEVCLPNKGHLSDPQIETLQLLADQLAVILLNSFRFSALQDSIERDRQLQQTISSGGEQKSLETVCRQFVQTLSALHPDCSVAFLMPEHKGRLRVKAYTGFGSDESNTLRLKSGSATELAAEKLESVYIHDASKKDGVQGLSPDSRSILAVPIKRGEILLGIINLENQKPNSFSESDLATVSGMADHLAPVLANFSFADQIRQQVDRQKQLFEITNKIRQSTNIQTILQTSVEEICLALQLPKAVIRVNPAALAASSQKESAANERKTR